MSSTTGWELFLDGMLTVNAGGAAVPINNGSLRFTDDPGNVDLPVGEEVLGRTDGSAEIISDGSSHFVTDVIAKGTITLLAD